MSPSLRIGFGLYEYDFPPGYIMGGYSARGKPSEGTHDPISARAVYIQEQLDRIILVECDVVGFSKDFIDKLKGYFEVKYSIPPQAIMIGVIHSHSSVLSLNLFTEPSEGVLEKLADGIKEAVARAIDNKFDAKVRLHEGLIKNVSFNRRDWDPLSEIVNDRAVIMEVLDFHGKVRGLLYNYSCHPVVMGPENLLLSADWPFFTQQKLREWFDDPDLPVMYLQGTPGNINPVNRPMSATVLNTFDDCKKIGNSVGEQLAEIIKNSIENNNSLELLSLEPIKYDAKIIYIPIDDEDKVEFFEEFATIVKKGDDFYVQTIIQAIRLGGLGIVCLPGEIFSEIGLNIKKNIELPFVMVVGYANDYIGYVGTPAVYIKGGYEMLMMALSEEEGSIIEKTAIETMKSLL